MTRTLHISPLTNTSKSLLQRVWYVIMTLFLFTKSDIKTTLIPVGMFAIASAPLYSLNKLPGTLFWIWIHLLQFDTSNQIVGAEEDRTNKPDRPVPSERLTIINAIALRWALIPACLIYSALYSREVVHASIALIVLTTIYNEFGAHACHWVIRNIVNAAGFASFEWGSTLTAGADPTQLTDVGVLAVCISFGIFATTIQTQDFKDVEGDQTINRKTLPIIFPEGSRYTPIVTLLVWSIILSFTWKLPAVVVAAFVGLAIFVGARFLFWRTRHNDQVSFYWYNVWLAAAHGLPGIWLLTCN
ncbi:UbiA prenyltransferase family [Collybia nuda]|uniref:UbiA prenyltransferase family n=1 Tax=Collybia nuda TaxID=64659 RepID=A0A9P5YG55_9AGAR|nr:UbiA prenyltransferase family [Collybia nuda]